MFKTGVAFSGGGIRSAAFCSGVLRRLLQRGVEPDYLSCVSGGGYTGTAYLDWKYRNDQKDDPSWHKRFFEHMRSRASVLCDWQRPLYGILDTLTIICLMLFVSVIIPFIMWGAYACPLAFSIDFLFGNILRADRVLCEYQQNRQNSTATSGASCAFEKGTQAYSRMILFAVPLALLFLSFIWTKVTSKWSGMAQVLSITCGLLFSLTFGSWFIHDFLDRAPRVIQLAVVIIGIIVWFVSPGLRRKTSIVIIVYSYAYIVYWRVYKADFGGILYTEKRFLFILFVSGLVMFFVPVLGSFHARLVHIYNRWRLQKAFYTEESVGTCGCAGIGWYDIFQGTHLCMPGDDEHRLQVGPLCLADLEYLKPQYIANIVVNEWRDDPHDKLKYDLMTMSPTEIERIVCEPRAEEFSGKLGSQDVKLSDAMATSAAVVSRHMGAFDELAEPYKHIQTILGLGMEAALVSDVDYEKREGCFLKFLPYCIEFFRVVPLVVIPAIYFTGAGDSILVPIGILVFFGFMVLLAVASVVSTGNENPGCLEKMARWLLVHVPFCFYVRDLLGVINTGPVPPAILRLSDGGHIENLAILPLLKRRLQRIVVVNGGYTVPDSCYGDDLLHALDLARQKLNCSFIGMNGRDVIQDIKHKFVMKEPGKQPRSYKFRVEYYDKEDKFGEDRKVGEGEIIFIAPRHPNKGIQKTEHVTWKDASHDIDVELAADLWGPGPDLEAAEVDRLTFCCCECCHDKPFCGISESLCGTFPQHVTANQFFTPAMFSAYHREGYRACVEAAVDEYLGAAPSHEMHIVES